MKHRQIYRLTAASKIDPSCIISFTFNGRKYEGHPGDTLASALLANGVRFVGRSFKYHRPRGIFSAGEEEPNALVSVRTGRRQMPTCRASLVELEPELSAESQNCYPSVRVDFGRLLDFSRVLWPAGFYNKTFKWPGWHWYEGVLRRIAGLGTLAENHDPCGYHHRNVHCEVLVCGGGAAGLAAAVAAGRSGARVILAEQDTAFGGRLLADPVRIDGRPGVEWVDSVLAELASMENVRLMRHATVSGYYDHNVLTIVDRRDACRNDDPVERLWKVRSSQVVVASGAIEQPLVFDYNDLPGTMLAGAVREYLNRYAVVPGKTIAVATNNDEAFRTAFQLHDRGLTVPAIIDTRESAGSAARTGAQSRGIPVLENGAIVARAGRNGLRGISVKSAAPDSKRPARQIACDTLAVSGGWAPTVHLYSQAGGRLRFDRRFAAFVPKECGQDVRVAGAANGEFDLAVALSAGFEAGKAAARDAGFKGEAVTVPEVSRDELTFGTVGPRIRQGGNLARQWIDLQHDVTAADIELAVRENFVSIEHVKRFTTAGMSVDQGKTSNLNTLTMVALLTRKNIEEVGTTTFRPQYTPVSMGAIAGPASGRFYAPKRLVPAHDWHKQRGAVFEDYGEWSRPAWYRRGDELREAAIMREAFHARQGSGLFDASPLGKIEVRGPDAAEFLNRIYFNNAITLKTGHVRYGLMLDENGILLDDGVFARLGPEHFLVSTTAANANRITVWLEEWHQCEWPELRVVIMPVRTQWAVATVFGPSSRALLSELAGDVDFSPDAFPHMRIRQGTVCGIEARVQRVSFTGECSFELSVPACHGEFLIRRIAEIGVRHDLTPVGVEAILALRIEKGYLHVGSDTDGTTNPFDVGFGGVLDRKKADFVGRRSLSRPSDICTRRRQFVGLEAVEAGASFLAGAHVVSGTHNELRSEGFVTSATVSPSLGAPIGLGMVEAGHSRKGEIVTLFDRGSCTQARIVDPVFYDRDGSRLYE